MYRRALIIGACLLLACGEAPMTPQDDPEPLVVLSVSPAVAAPGAIVQITGVDATSFTGAASLTIDGHDVRVIVATGGSLLAAVPLYVEDDGTVEPLPTRAVDSAPLNPTTTILRSSVLTIRLSIAFVRQKD